MRELLMASFFLQLSACLTGPIPLCKREYQEGLYVESTPNKTVIYSNREIFILFEEKIYKRHALVCRLEKIENNADELLIYKYELFDTSTLEEEICKSNDEFDIFMPMSMKKNLNGLRFSLTLINEQFLQNLRFLRRLYTLDMFIQLGYANINQVQCFSPY